MDTISTRWLIPNATITLTRIIFAAAHTAVRIPLLMEMTINRLSIEFVLVGSPLNCYPMLEAKPDWESTYSTTLLLLFLNRRHNTMVIAKSHATVAAACSVVISCPCVKYTGSVTGEL